MAILLLQLKLADEVADLLADLLYPPVDWPMDLNGNSTLWAHIGWWIGRSIDGSTPNPYIFQWDLNGNFTSLSSYGQIYWHFYPHPPVDLPWIWMAISLFQLILEDEVADLPHVDLAMDLNGNFTVTAHIGRWSCRSTGWSTPTPVDLLIDLIGNFTLWAHIGRWSGKIYWQIYPTPSWSANEYQWQFYSLSSHLQMMWHIYWQIYPTPLYICQWIWMAILLFELILADEVADLLADLPHPL